MAALISAGFRPPMISSRHSTSGSVASARAVSSLLSSPRVSVPARAPARARRVGLGRERPGDLEPVELAEGQRAGERAGARAEAGARENVADPAFFVGAPPSPPATSEEHTSELQTPCNL